MTSVNAVQPSNADVPIAVKLSGRLIRSRDVQFIKADSLMYSMEFGRITSLS